jgi:hypothetical protein
MDNRIFYNKFPKTQPNHYKTPYLYVISQDPKVLKLEKNQKYPPFKVGITYDNIMKRLSDYQTCFREFLVHALFEFPLKDIENAENAIHKQFKDKVFYKKYVPAGTKYMKLDRVKTKNGYVIKELGMDTATKDMLINDYKKRTEWVSSKLGEIYYIISKVLKEDPTINSVTGYKMSAEKITELKAFKQKQVDDSVYVTKSGTVHKKANKTTLEYRKGSFYNVIQDESKAVTKEKVKQKYPVVIVDGTKFVNKPGFDYYPAEVRRASATSYDVYYFNENTMDTIYPSQSFPFTKKAYERLSAMSPSKELQTALDMAYFAKYGKTPAK